MPDELRLGFAAGLPMMTLDQAFRIHAPDREKKKGPVRGL
jgi:hypothetical protein